VGKRKAYQKLSDSLFLDGDSQATQLPITFGRILHYVAQADELVGILPTNTEQVSALGKLLHLGLYPRMDMRVFARKVPVELKCIFRGSRWHLGE
jgi:hypothetical protein